MTTTRKCTGACSQLLKANAFEGNRKKCIKCRNKDRSDKKKTATQAAKSNPLEEQKIIDGTACSEKDCKKPFARKDFPSYINERGERRYKGQCHECKRRQQVASDAAKGTRECRAGCDRTLPAEAFADGYTCKECKKRKHEELMSEESRDSKRARAPAPPALQQCEGPCGQLLPPDRFALREDLKDPKWRSVCKTCQQVAKDGTSHSQNFRDRQRAEDEEGFLERNAAGARRWRAENPEKQAELMRRRATEVEQKWKSQLQRGVPDDTELKCLLVQDCFYCGCSPQEGVALNEIDRVIPGSQGGQYTVENTVPACHLCNNMKRDLPSDTFVFIVRRIASHVGACPVQDLLPTSTDSSKITKEERSALWVQPCYLCGHCPSMGLDQVLARKGYTHDNVQPCCSECNYAKRDTTLQRLLDKVQSIVAHTEHWVLGDNLLVMNPGHAAQTVVGESEGTRLVFRSAHKAGEFAGCSHVAILKAIVSGGFSRGMHWTACDALTYYGGSVAEDTARDAMTHCRQATQRRQSKGV